MIRFDEYSELVVSDGSEVERQQASLLRAFFRQSIGRRCSGEPLVKEINLGTGNAEQDFTDKVVRSLAPLWPRETVIVFDVGSLLKTAGVASVAVLPPMSVDQTLQLQSADPAESLTRLRTLQYGLRVCRAVVVFDARQARAIATLGAKKVHVFPLPAMAAPQTEQPPPGGLLLIAHDIPTDFASELASTLQSSIRELRITIVMSAERHTVPSLVVHDAVQADVHVHVGYAREPVAPFRVIDSFAARKPVIHVALGKPPIVNDELARMQMAVEALRTGFLTHNVEDVVPLVRQARSDAGMREVFFRNMDRTVTTFNATIERNIWELLS